MMRAWRGWVVALALLASAPARAHDFKPALLALVEAADGSYDVLWRLPLEAAGDGVAPRFPDGTARAEAGARVRDGDMVVERFRVRRAGGLGGQTLRLSGQSRFVTEVLVRVELAGGRVVTGRLPTAPGGSFTIPARPSRAGLALTYLRLGVEHIITGIDHLAFVLGLVLLSTSGAAIVRSVTAFTAAHSVTLGLAALGLAHVPGPPVEATIALSIVYLARELVRRRAGERARPLTAVAFGFGLLHGLGFAGALAEVGLPAGDIPLSLLCFNLGVELGQLGFVLLVLAVRRGLRPLLAALARGGPRLVRVQAALRAAPALAIGTLGAFWLIERVAGFFG